MKSAEHRLVEKGRNRWWPQHKKKKKKNKKKRKDRKQTQHKEIKTIIPKLKISNIQPTHHNNTKPNIIQKTTKRRRKRSKGCQDNKHVERRITTIIKKYPIK